MKWHSWYCTLPPKLWCVHDHWWHVHSTT